MPICTTRHVCSPGTLEQRVEAQTREVRREHDNTQALLRIITELSSSLDLGSGDDPYTGGARTRKIDSHKVFILLNDGKVYVSGVELTPFTGGSVGRRTGSLRARRYHVGVVRRRASALVDDITVGPALEI